MYELLRVYETMSSYFSNILLKGVRKRSIAYIQTFGLLLTKIGHDLSFVGAYVHCHATCASVEIRSPFHLLRYEILFGGFKHEVQL